MSDNKVIKHITAIHFLLKSESYVDLETNGNMRIIWKETFNNVLKKIKNMPNLKAKGIQYGRPHVCGCLKSINVQRVPRAHQPLNG